MLIPLKCRQLSQGNPRVTMSIRVDKGLKKQFTLASRAFFGSTCNPVEVFMASVVGIYKNQDLLRVNRSITMDIGEIRIERNLRERRKVTKVSEAETGSKRCTIARCVTGGNKCPGIAVASARYLPTNTEYLLCAAHFTACKTQLKIWKLLFPSKDGDNGGSEKNHGV